VFAFDKIVQFHLNNNTNLEREREREPKENVSRKGKIMKRIKKYPKPLIKIEGVIEGYLLG